MRIRTWLRIFSTLVIAFALMVAVISALDLRNNLEPFAVAVATILLAGLLWMLTEISQQLAELLAERKTGFAVREATSESAAAPQSLPSPPAG